ncbi:malonyl-ACP O-methyltransferase BioC [Halioxenophilus sp. WMMB6]|uniref:malonyl-ACP O-methyltransferase BioC n=1 Tax=Halioxenophilus sp. WMMB6 TaxID=3073815 RepID=UPI00295EC41C|nr:malonyl-ACP O-methyltransferase BioC [Halioxenophilus sp. WMMB6]
MTRAAVTNTTSVSPISARKAAPASLVRAGFYPARGQRLLAEPLVLLHGWGCDSRIWGRFASALNQQFDLHLIDLPGFGENGALPANLESLLPLLPKRGYYLGWSLGGMVATELAVTEPERVLGLITLAANGRFVATEAWPAAMAPATFNVFYEGLAQSLPGTLKRFALLCGAGLEKADLTWLRQAYLAGAEELSGDSYRSGLDWLAQCDNQQALTQLTQPSLHLLGDSDTLVPAAAAPALIERLAQAPVPGVVRLLAAGHTLFLQAEAAVLSAICEWLAEQQPLRDKSQVARSFSRAASSYDSVAGLQRRVGEQLLSHYRYAWQTNPEILLDLGSGTGYFSQLLAERLPETLVVSADIALGMLNHARVRGFGHCFSAADAEQLPFATGSVGGIFSSLAIQWCECPSSVLAELHRVLRPGGVALVATLGEGTMVELASAWQQVDSYRHVNEFTPAAVLTTLAGQLGFRRVTRQSECITEYFPDLKSLSHALKALGAHNVNQGQAAGLNGRAKLKALTAAYESLRVSAGLPLSYQVEYLCLER